MGNMTAIVSTVQYGAYYNCSVQFLGDDSFSFFDRWYTEEFETLNYISDNNQEIQNSISNLSFEISKKQNLLKQERKWYRPWTSPKEKELMNDIDIYEEKIKKYKSQIIDIQKCDEKSFLIKKTAIDKFLTAWGFVLSSVNQDTNGKKYMWKLE